VITASQHDARTRLIKHLGKHLADDPAWQPALARLHRGTAVLHLAVLVEPFLRLLLDGTKTIESRFSRIRCAPWAVLHEGHIVAVKKTGGPVLGAFQAGEVHGYHITPDEVGELRKRFAERICATSDEFWARRAGTSYATLAEVIHPRPVPGLPFPKRDRRGWVVLDAPTAEQPRLL
jgi:hypothetical protein